MACKCNSMKNKLCWGGEEIQISFWWILITLKFEFRSPLIGPSHCSTPALHLRIDDVIPLFGDLLPIQTYLPAFLCLTQCFAHMYMRALKHVVEVVTTWYQLFYNLISLFLVDVALAGTLPWGFFPLSIPIFNVVKLLIYIRHHLLWVLLMLNAFFPAHLTMFHESSTKSRQFNCNSTFLMYILYYIFDLFGKDTV